MRLPEDAEVHIESVIDAYVDLVPDWETFDSSVLADNIVAALERLEPGEDRR